MRKTVLVVDDDQQVLLTLKEGLERYATLLPYPLPATSNTGADGSCSARLTGVVVQPT